MTDDLSRVRVLFCYRSFRAFPGVSHVGLGISSTNNYRVLRQNGIDALVQGIGHESELRRPLDADPAITHLISSAPWMRTNALAYACDQFPEVNFAVNCHSNIAFLQSDPGAIRLIREEMDLETWKHNFHVAGNSEVYCDAMTSMYQSPVTFLPNLYYLDDNANAAMSKPGWNGGMVRFGIWGAPRAQKNVLTGVSGCMIAGRDLNVPIEIWMNSGRNDGGEAIRILNAVRAMTEGVPNVTLRFLNWTDWPTFRRFAATMDAGVQVSTSETYNIVTSDMAAQGVPSVVSDAILWAPDEWRARVDSAQDVARKLVGVLLDPASGRRGLEALAERNGVALEAWKRYLLENQFGIGGRRWTAVGHPKAGVRNLSRPGRLMRARRAA